MSRKPHSFWRLAPPAVPAALWLVASPLGLRAQDKPNPGSLGLGFGLILGTPFGGTAKYWLDSRFAADLAVGVQGSDFDMHADLLVHPEPLPLPGSKDKTAKIPFYIGLGFKFRDTREDTIGIRFLGGIYRRFKERRLEVFAELAPVLRVTPSLDSLLDGGAGLRYYFG